MDAPLTPPVTPGPVNPNNLPVMGPGEVVSPRAPEAPVPAEAAPVQGVSPAPATPVPAPGTPSMVVPQPAVAVQSTPAPTGQIAPTPLPTPATAGDVDVIEAEWVDKAEDVVQAHLGDPYGEEEAVEVLQEDYLQKRYGLTVKEPEDDQPKPGPV